MMVKIEQQTHDWIATVRALGLQLGEPNVVNDKDKVIKKCIDYLSMRPKELLLDAKNISADTRAIVDREYIDVLVGNKAYNQKFLHYSGSHDGPVELSLSDDNGKNSALKKVAGDKSAPENTLGYEVPKLLLDVDKFSKKNNGFLHLNRDQCETYFKENTPPDICIVLPMDFRDEGHLGYFILKHPTDEDFFKFEHLNLLANIITNASARSIRRIQWGNRTQSLIKFASFLENST